MSAATRALGAALVAVSLTASACGSSSGEEGGEVSIAMIPGVYNALPTYLAQEQGFFEDHGVTVDLIDSASGPTALAAVISGSAAVTSASPQILAAAAQKGQDLRYFCGQSSRFAADLLAAPDTDLPTLEEAGGDWKQVFTALKGKKIGVIALGGVVDMAMKAALKEAGLEADDYEFIASGAGQAAVSALTTGQVDVLYGYPFITQRLLAQDQAVLLMDMSASVPLFQEMYSGGWAATSDWIDTHPDEATAICNAWRDAIEFIAEDANAAEVNAALAAHFQLADSETQDLARTTVSSGYYTADIPRDVMNETLGLLAETGAIAQPAPTYDDVVKMPAQ